MNISQKPIAKAILLKKKIQEMAFPFKYTIDFGFFVGRIT